MESWNDSGDEEGNVNFLEFVKCAAEELALHAASEMCKTGKMNFSREDHPRMRDANILIDTRDVIDELEGFLDCMVSTESRNGESSRLDSILYSLHAAMDEGWSEFEKEKGEKRHAVLDPWHTDDRLAKFISLMVKCWMDLLFQKCENKEPQSPPPLHVLELLLKFDPIHKELEKTNGITWKALQELKKELCDTTEKSKRALREAAKARMAKVKPGVTVCYECEEDDHEEEFSVSEEIDNLIWAKEQEGYTYDSKPEKLLFCESCFEDYCRY